MDKIVQKFVAVEMVASVITYLVNVTAVQDGQGHFVMITVPMANMVSSANQSVAAKMVDHVMLYLVHVFVHQDGLVLYVLTDVNQIIMEKNVDKCVNASMVLIVIILLVFDSGFDNSFWNFFAFISSLFNFRSMSLCRWLHR